MGPSIAILGAGFSGLCAGVQLKKRGFEDFVVFDENEDVGGTWLVNKYPGCACDIPSHLYSFSFEPNPNWSQFFSPQPEILEYARHVARKYDLYRHARFHTKVIKALWVDALKQWEVTTKNTETGEDRVYRFDIMFAGVGGLRVPKIPEEFEAFKGPKMHSAEWNSEVELKGKKVGIVGSGASAIQIIPSIAKDVKELVIFQRRPAWIVPRPQFDFPQWAQKALGTIPGAQWALRASIFWLYEATYSIYFTNSYLNSFVRRIGKNYLKSSMKKDEEMRRKLEPDYPIGCKRIAPHNEYYEALKLPQVKLTTSRIQEVKGGSIVTEDGVETPLQVLVLATGFKVADFFAPLEIVGADGRDLLQLWKDEGPSTYHGIVSHALPNAFLLIGPNSAPGHISALFSIECQVGWSVGVLEEMVRREAAEVRVKEWAEKLHMDKLREKLKRTVWAEECGNWYVDKRGMVIAINPVTAVSYWAVTRKPDFNALSFL